MSAEEGRASHKDGDVQKSASIDVQMGFDLNNAIPIFAICCFACVQSCDCLPLGGSCELFGVLCKQECCHDGGQLCTCCKVTQCCAIDSCNCCKCEGGRCCHVNNCCSCCCCCRSSNRGCCTNKVKPAKAGPSVELPSVPRFTGPSLQGRCMKCECCPGKPIHFGQCNVKHDCCGLDCCLCGFALPCRSIFHGICSVGFGSHCIAGGPCMLVCMGLDLCFRMKVATGCCFKVATLNANIST